MARALLDKPQVERKAALAKLLEGTDRNGVVRLSDHFEVSGSEMMQHAREHGLEGLISKRRDAPYQLGAQRQLGEVEVGQNQEFVIVGYKDASHLKGAIGALVLGYNEGGKLHYAGRSGTGYTMETARDLWKKLQPLRRADPAFGKIPEEERGRKGIWVEPKLVAEIDVPRLHGAEARAPRRVQGLARGQAREGNRAGDADADDIKSEEGREAESAPSRRQQTAGGR